MLLVNLREEGLQVELKGMVSREDQRLMVNLIGIEHLVLLVLGLLLVELLKVCVWLDTWGTKRLLLKI